MKRLLFTLTVLLVAYTCSAQLIYYRNTNTLRLQNDTAATRAYARLFGGGEGSTDLTNYYTKPETSTQITNNIEALKAAATQLASIGFLKSDTVLTLVTKSDLANYGGGGSATKRMSFRVGSTTGAPAAGAVSMTIPQFVGHRLEVFRGTATTGLFMQNIESTNGYAFNSATGLLNVYPAFASGDRFIIQASANEAWSDVAPNAGGGAPVVSVPSPNVYWDLEDVGSPADDKVGSVNLTAYYSPTFRVTGKRSYGVDFTPNNSALSSASPINATTDKWSISMWFKFDVLPSTHGHDGVLFRSSYSTSPWYAISMYSASSAAGNLRFHFKDAAWANYDIVLAEGTITTGVWYHVCGVLRGNGQYASLYLNGQRTNDVTVQSGNIADSDLYFTIGNNSHLNVAFHMDGAIDEIGIWTDYALTDADVAQLYNSGAGISFPW